MRNFSILVLVVITFLLSGCATVLSWSTVKLQPLSDSDLIEAKVQYRNCQYPREIELLVDPDGSLWIYCPYYYESKVPSMAHIGPDKPKKGDKAYSRATAARKEFRKIPLESCGNKCYRPRASDSYVKQNLENFKILVSGSDYLSITYTYLGEAYAKYRSAGTFEGFRKAYELGKQESDLQSMQTLASTDAERALLQKYLTAPTTEKKPAVAQGKQSSGRPAGLPERIMKAGYWAQGVVPNTQECGVNGLDDYTRDALRYANEVMKAGAQLTQFESAPRWFGTCFDGHAQGPGQLVWKFAHSGNAGYYIAFQGFMKEGAFMLHPFVWRGGVLEASSGIMSNVKKVSNERERFTPLKMDRVTRDFFGKYSALGPVSAKDGCEMNTFGVFYPDEEWGSGLSSYFKKRNGAPEPELRVGAEGMIDNKNGGTAPVSGLIAMGKQGITGWDGQCVDGKVEGYGKFKVNGVPFEGYFHKGSAAGKLSFKKDKYDLSAWIYKGIWFDSFSSFYGFIQSDPSSAGTSQLPKDLRDRINNPKRSGTLDDIDEYFVSQRLQEWFDLGLNIASTKGKPATISNNIFILPVDIEASGAHYFLNWDIKPRSLSTIPTDIDQIDLVIDVDVSVVKSISVWIIGGLAQSTEHERSSVTISLKRSQGFRSSGNKHIMDIATYVAGFGGNVEVKKIEPSATLKAVEFK